MTSVIAAARHPVTRHGVSTYDDSVTREVLEATVAGESLGAVAARLVGAEVVAVDAGVLGDPVAGAVECRPTAPQGDLVSSDALTGTMPNGWWRPAATGPGPRPATRHPRGGGHRQHDGRFGPRGGPAGPGRR